MTLLLCCLFGLMLSQTSAASCPEDYHGICRTDFRYRVTHDWIPYANATSANGINWRVIIDQYDYQNLLGQFSIPPGVWQAVDHDGDGIGWIQGSGGTCTYQLRTNSYRRPNSNNWCFTQAISYCDAVELIVNASVRFSGCTQRPDCIHDYVILHRFDTNSPNEIDRMKPENYDYCFEDEAVSKLQQNPRGGDTQIVKRFLRPNTSHTYFGIQDIGTTGQVQRFMVYYKVCQKNENGLQIYPEIPLPPQSSNKRTMRLAQCVPHAHNITSLETYAYSDRCEQTVTCECDAGYEEPEDSSSCIPCRKGYYKSEQNSTCVPCPQNTKLDKEAADHCECEEGYFRAPNEGIGVSCTAPPDPIPNDLRIVSICDTTAMLEWDKPNDVGRNDFYYNVSRSNPDTEESVVVAPVLNDNSTVVRYTVTGLTQKTTYTFSVCVHNGVSEQDSANAKLRVVSKQGTTKQGSTFMHNNVALPNNSVVLREEIGEGDKALSCRTLSDAQCGGSSSPEMFYPNKTQVSSDGQTMYSSYGTGLVYLNRKEGDKSPLGAYCCKIQDSQGNIQKIFIKIGTMEADAPTCPLRPLCGSLPTPANGQVIVTSTTFGSTASYRCNSGYDLIGVSSRTCQSSGQWSGTAPVCTPASPPPTVSTTTSPPAEIVCSLLENPENGMVVQFGNTPGSLALYRCNEGYQLESGGSSTTTCGEDGRWTGLAPTCEVGCPPLDHPARGLVTISGGHSPGAVATYSCDGGLQLLGPSTRTCQSDGKWSDEEPSCSNIGFQFNGQFYPNGSSLSLSSIGEGENALLCITDGLCCNPPNRAGEFYYPNGDKVRTQGTGDDLYRNRRDGMIRLNRRNEASSPTGNYTCEIPDFNGHFQELLITLN